MPSSPLPCAGDPADRTTAADPSDAAQLAELVAAVRREDAVARRRQDRWRTRVEADDASLGGVLRQAAAERAEVPLWVRGLDPVCPAIVAVAADHVVVRLDDRRQAAIPFAAIDRCGPASGDSTGSSLGPGDGDGEGEGDGIEATHLRWSRLVDRLDELAPITVEIVDRAGRRVTGRVAGCGADVLVLDPGDGPTLIPIEAIVLVAAAATA